MSGPELCVVVLSYRNERVVAEAVDSLLGQGIALEIVVSHSGGGPTPDLLASRAGVRVVAAHGRLLPGGARNAGVAATSAPFVAFLEADSVACPGWAAGRLARHRNGAVAVATPVVPLNGGVCARALWLNEHAVRLPLPDPAADVPHGVSYAREALDRHGPFPEDWLVGEDTFVNERLLEAGVEIAWAPEVVTRHRYPTSLPAALADSYRRGLRTGRGDRSITLRRRLRWISRGPARNARRAAPLLSRRELRVTMPVMAACATAKAAGLVVAHVSRP